MGKKVAMKKLGKKMPMPEKMEKPMKEMAKKCAKGSKMGM